MDTSEAHGDATQQAFYLIKMGGLPCAGNAHPVGIDLIDHSAYSPFIRSRLTLGDRVSLLVI